MRLRSTTALAACTAVAILAAIGTPARAAGGTFGVFPGVLTRAEMSQRLNTLMLRPAARPGALRGMSTYRGVPPVRTRKAKVAGWVSDGFGYIWGLNAAGKVVSYHDDCVEPGAGRVDHAGNLVVSCTVGGQFNGIPGNVNVYKAGNTRAPADIVLTDSNGGLPFDAFEDNAGNIYAVNAVNLACGPSGCSESPGNIVRWSVGNQSSGALPDTTYTDPNLFQIQSADIDAGGTIYLDGFDASFAPEVDSLSGGTATDLNISIVYPGGVYVVSPNGTAPALSLLDQIGTSGGTLYQFALPISPSASPIVNEATPQDFEHRCDPVAAGYATGGAEASLGLDGCKAMADGSPATDQWKVRLNLDYVEPFQGLFVPSDK